jgi:hypothetical protein
MTWRKPLRLQPLRQAPVPTLSWNSSRYALTSIVHLEKVLWNS